MTVDEAVSLLDRLLAEAPADPAGAWAAFRTWAYQRVSCDRDELEVSVGYADGTAWIEFRRSFEDVAADHGEDVVLRFSCSRPNAPRLAEVGERCDDRNDLADFFERVEDLPGFGPALAYPYWELEAERG